jgi:prophage regulatory protein
MVEANRVFLSDVQVAARYAVSRTTIWRWSNETEFPGPVRLGPGTTRWRLSELEDWEDRHSPTR